MKRNLLILTVALCGCASNSGIVPLGNDTYVISKQASTGFSGTGPIKTAALQEASAQCLDQDKAVDVVSVEESEPPYLLGNYPTVELTFRCLSDSAP